MFKIVYFFCTYILGLFFPFGAIIFYVILVSYLTLFRAYSFLSMEIYHLCFFVFFLFFWPIYIAILLLFWSLFFVFFSVFMYLSGLICLLEPRVLCSGASLFFLSRVYILLSVVFSFFLCSFFGLSLFFFLVFYSHQDLFSKQNLFIYQKNYFTKYRYILIIIYFLLSNYVIIYLLFFHIFINLLSNICSRTYVLFYQRHSLPKI